MLTQDDIALIRNTRAEITNNRTDIVTLKGEVKTGENPITGEPIIEPKWEDVSAVVDEITSAFKLDRSLVDGVQVEEGDIWVDIDTGELTLLSAKTIEVVEYNDDKYTVMAADLAGLGGVNRVIILGRLTG